MEHPQGNGVGRAQPPGQPEAHLQGPSLAAPASHAGPANGADGRLPRPGESMDASDLWLDVGEEPAPPQELAILASSWWFVCMLACDLHSLNACSLHRFMTHACVLPACTTCRPIL